MEQLKRHQEREEEVGQEQAKEQTQMSGKDTIRTLQLIDTTLLKCYIKVE